MKLGRLPVLLVLILISSCSFGSNSVSNQFDSDLGESRRQAALEAFAAIELPPGMQWPQATEIEEPKPGISNQNNPTPGQISFKLTAPTDRPPNVWMDELDLAFRASGLIEGYRFKDNPLGTCEEPFRRQYRHVETHDMMTVTYDTTSAENPTPIQLSYRYTSIKGAGTFDFPGDRTETWNSPAC